MRLELVHLFFIPYEGNAHTFFLAMLGDVLDLERKNARKGPKSIIVFGTMIGMVVLRDLMELIKNDKDKKTYQVIFKSSLKRPEMPSLC